MIKFKVYWVFFALVYSFFFNTVVHKNNFVPKGKIAAESQIRLLDLKNEEKIVVPLKTIDTIQSTISNSNNNTTPLSLTFIFDVVCKIKKIKLPTDNEKNFLFKSLATEKYRVLRN